MESVDLRSAWKQLADEIPSANYEPDNFLKGQPYPKVTAQLGKWHISLTGADLPKGLKQTTIEALYPFDNGCEFLLCKGSGCNLIDHIGSHIKTNDPIFDQHFTIKTKDSTSTLGVLADAEFRNRLNTFKDIRLQFKKAEIQYVLEFWDSILIVDVPSLKELFHVMAEMLDRLYIQCNKPEVDA